MQVNKFRITAMSLDWSWGMAGEDVELDYAYDRRLETLCGSSNLRFASSRPYIGYGLSPAREAPLLDLEAQPAPNFGVISVVRW